ncbi:hypothetical protein G7K_3443-t1 [Saitoella complicata NRRL Y-17804]|uniref:Cytochrome b5 heme-binding domain-containing protein n=2 Tax=Saitoella complicata (strain BCRC 22490 / CBS 7301 / JCM 7358 / NBRC 10748 / NRRL Y-17804) TaxID=698492 RepID=A0A0E9NHW1_SAICN|nr:hypothetical protein G7K_3443-t1 [Saitoella complicata NRRL Y-17804]
MDDAPAFPALNSAQRLSSSASSSLAPPSNMVAPGRLPPPTSSLGPPRLAVPARLPGGLTPPPTTTVIPAKPRQKVVLTPGHSPLDWARLTLSGQNLRGVTSFQKVTPSELKKHRRKDDAWMALNGKVYNVTAYLPFHPGGEQEVMRAAGRDGTKLYMNTHAWVNYDNLLKECLVGFMVPEPEDSDDE